jgi:hypothetical protein
MKNPLLTLGMNEEVARKARSTEELKKLLRALYRAQVSVLHPDKNPAEDKKRAETLTRELTNAYELVLANLEEYTEELKNANWGAKRLAQIDATQENAELETLRRKLKQLQQQVVPQLKEERKKREKLEEHNKQLEKHLTTLLSSLPATYGTENSNELLPHEIAGRYWLKVEGYVYSSREKEGESLITFKNDLTIVKARIDKNGSIVPYDKRTQTRNISFFGSVKTEQRTGEITEGGIIELLPEIKPTVGIGRRIIYYYISREATGTQKEERQYTMTGEVKAIIPTSQTIFRDVPRRGHFIRLDEIGTTEVSEKGAPVYQRLWPQITIVKKAGKGEKRKKYNTHCPTTGEFTCIELETPVIIVRKN